MGAPAIVLTLFLTGLFAALFHLIWAQRNSAIIAIWLLGLIGFIFGHWLATDMDLALPTLGTIHIIPATIGSLCGMLIANALKL